MIVLLYLSVLLLQVSVPYVCIIAHTATVSTVYCYSVISTANSITMQAEGMV